MCRRHGRTDSVRPVAEDLQSVIVNDSIALLFEKIPTSRDSVQLLRFNQRPLIHLPLFRPIPTSSLDNKYHSLNIHKRVHNGSFRKSQDQAIPQG